MYARILTIVGLVVLSLVALQSLSSAQPGPAAATGTAEPTRVAVCNPGTVFTKLDERTAIEDRMKANAAAVQADLKRQQDSINELKEIIKGLNPDSVAWKDKNAELTQKVVQFQVAVQIAQVQQAAREKEQVRLLYEKITAACQAVAEQKKFDMVLCQQRPEIPQDMTNITPDQLRVILSQINPLYVGPKVDITMDVVTKLNTDYARPRP